MYTHFTFKDGSNPYIVKTPGTLWQMVKKYEFETIGENTYLVTGENTENKSYTDLKKILRCFAIEWSLFFNEYQYSYEELAFYSDFFTTYGKKYGLLREFKENAIC